MDNPRYRKPPNKWVYRILFIVGLIGLIVGVSTAFYTGYVWLHTGRLGLWFYWSSILSCAFVVTLALGAVGHITAAESRHSTSSINSMR